MHVCICMHACMYVLMHACMYLYACMHVCMYVCIYVCMYVWGDYGYELKCPHPITRKWGCSTYHIISQYWPVFLPHSRKSKKKCVTRVPAISEKIADIPSDNYAWRKYGQKPIKGSPYPRCSFMCVYVYIFTKLHVYIFLLMFTIFFYLKVFCFAGAITNVVVWRVALRRSMWSVLSMILACSLWLMKENITIHNPPHENFELYLKFYSLSAYVTCLHPSSKH